MSIPFRVEPEEWTRSARCRGMPTAMFYIGRGESVDELRAICAECPVIAECRDYGDRTETVQYVFGFLGGESAIQRERRRGWARAAPTHRSRPDPSKATHGTITGFGYYGCKCDACTAAQRRYHAEYRRRRRAGAA